MRDLTERDLKRMAEAWANAEGAAALAEAGEIKRQGLLYLTPRADKAVRALSGGAARRVRRRAVFAFAAAAACVVIAVRAVTGAGDIALLGTAGAPSAENAADMADGAVESDAGASLSDMAAPEAPAAQDNAEIASGGAGETGAGASQSASENAGGAPAHAPAPENADAARETSVYPIAFTLPADYRVISADEDNGTSVYSLESATRGAVTLTMTDAAGAAPLPGMDEVIIDGEAVSAKIDDAYVLLAFERGGLRYTLSGEDNLGELKAFYRSIAEQLPE